MKPRHFFLSVIALIALFTISSCNNKKPPIDDEKQPVSIIFDTGTTDVTVDTLTGNQGDILEKPQDPKRDGYVFLYWTLQDVEYTFSVFPSRTIILKAKWAKGYSVHYNSNPSGVFIESVTYLEGEEIGELPVLETFFDDEKAYTFSHWSKDGAVYTPGLMPAEDILLNAVWEESLFIKFNVGLSSDTIEPLLYSEGMSISAPKIVPKREGYFFKNWFYQGKPYIFDSMPAQSLELEAQYQEVTSEFQTVSTLPKMYIDLENNLPLDRVNREDYNNSSITIFSNNTEHELTSVAAEFRGRGHGSWTDSGDKRGYRIKFFSKQSMFGEAKSKHWVLLAGANFNDETLFKAPSAFTMANEVFSHIEYTTSSNWVELYVNGDYRGVYMVMEHIRVDKDRVNVKAEYGILDTGYLIELDAYAHEEGPEGIYYFKVPGIKYPFVVKGPDPDDYLDKGLTEAQFRDQVNYIKDYTTSVFNAALNKDLNAFMEKADINSFIDMYLLHELYKNTDTGWSSFYMYKKPGGKLYAGPAWDFDASAGASRGDSSTEGFYVSDKVSELSPHTASELYINLMQIEEFRNLAKARFQALTPTIKSFINDFISDEFIEEHTFAFGRNFAFWGRNGYSHPQSIEQAQIKWIEKTHGLKNWLLNRTDWLYQNF